MQFMASRYDGNGTVYPMFRCHHHWGWDTYIPILQEEQSLCFLKDLQNIHLGQSQITCSSPFYVAGVGRSIITLFYIYKISKLLEGGNATALEAPC